MPVQLPPRAASVSLTACHCLPTDEIHELHKREQELGIKPDPDLLAFMKASAKRGKRHSIMTDYVMRILGLEVCSSVGASPRILLQLDLQCASAAQLAGATGTCMLGCVVGCMLAGQTACLQELKLPLPACADHRQSALSAATQT